MYKVMIVDDERQIVDGLCKMINWAEFGFAVCATARNGMEAIPLIKAHQPDLVMTDVRMPVMDGLKMLEHVRENISEDMEFIILSGFSEFQYAQKALQYNVKSYILKPIDETEFYSILVDIKNILDEKQIRKSLQIKSYISNFIGGDESVGNELILENEKTFGLRYLAIERHREDVSLSSDCEEDNNSDLSKCIAEKIGEYNMRFVLRHDRNKCHMVVGHTLLSSFEYDVKHLALTVNEFLWICKSLKVDILIGKKVAEFKNLHESVQSIAMCRNKLFYQKKRSVILYDDIKDEQFVKVFDDNGAVVKIISAFRKNESEKLISFIGQLIERLVNLQAVPEVAMLHLDSIMASIIQILYERNEEIKSVLELYSKIKKLQNDVNIFVLGGMLIEFCLYCYEFSQNRLQTENNDIVTKVTRYVNENYAEPLKIADIADRFFVNSAYLGQQFAKKKGCTFNHYLNTVRIEKAKELLINTNHKIYEIAQKIGYDDSNYFSSKFLEHVGHTPSDYRNRK